MPTSQEADPLPSQRNLRSRTRICTATAAVPSRSLSTAAVAAAVDLSFRSPRRSCSPSISLGVTSPSSCGSAHHPRPALDHELATTATVRRPAKRVKAWDDPDFGESTGSEDEAEQLLLEEEDVIDISLHCGRSAMPTWSTPAVVGSDGEVDQVQEEGIVQGMEEDEEDEEDDDDELDSDDDEIEVIAQRVPPTLDASLRGPPILASSTSLSWSGPIPVISPSPATGTQGLLQNSEGEPVQPAYHPSPIRGSKGNKSEVYPSFIQGQRRWAEKRSHRAHPPELAPLRILPPIGDHRSMPSTQDPRVARLLENHYVPPPPHSRPQHSSSNMTPLHPPMGRPPPFRPPLPPRAMVNLPPSNYAALSPRWASHLSPAQSSGSGAPPRHFPTPTAPFLMPLGLDGRSPAAPPGTHSPFRSPWMKDYDTGTSAAASQMHNLASGGIAPTPRRAGFTSLGGGVIAVTTPRVAGSWSKQPLMGAGYAVPGRIDEQAAPSLPTTAVSAPPAAEPLRVVFEDPPLPSAGRVEIAKGKRQVAFDPALPSRERTASWTASQPRPATQLHLHTSPSSPKCMYVETPATPELLAQYKLQQARLQPAYDRLFAGHSDFDGKIFPPDSHLTIKRHLDDLDVAIQRKLSMEHEEPSIYTLDLIDVFKRLRTPEDLRQRTYYHAEEAMLIEAANELKALKIRYPYRKLPPAKLAVYEAIKRRLVIVGNALRVPIWIEPPKKNRDDLVRNLPWYERRRKKRKLDMGNRENESLPTGADSSQLHA